MNIAMVVSTFPPEIGGMGQVAYEETMRLTKKGHTVTVFTLSRESFVLSLLWQVRFFDIIHLHFPFYGAGWLVVMACLFFRKPYVVTYHMDARPTSWLKHFIQLFVDFLVTPLLFKRAKKVMVPDVDYFLVSDFKRFISTGKLVNLANGVDTTLFAPGEVDWSKLGSLPDWRHKKIILFVGNLLPVKRVDLLLAAMAQTQDDEVLLVVGGGYDEKKARQEAVGLGDRVYFTGTCTDRQVLANYYRLASVVAIPSERESFSLVALEAMATGKPVIASDIKSLHNRIGKAGLFFQAGSVEGLRTVLDSFFSLPAVQRTSMGKLGRELALSEYSWDGHVAFLEKLYL